MTTNEQAAMCLICDESAEIDGVVWCNRKGRRCASVRQCEHWPDADGVTRWAGLTWKGVPLPGRIYLRIRLLGKSRPPRLPGCGCIKPLKDAAVAAGLARDDPRP